MNYEIQMKSLIHRVTAWAALFLSLVYFSACVASADQRVKLVVNSHIISATVANTFAQRQKGLMNRRHLAADEGMLFVFPKADNHAMWMKNTLIPLDVAFIDQNGVIINIEEMAPLSLDQHSAQKPAKYALEMNAGWFFRNEAKTGNHVQGLDEINKNR